MPDLIAGACQVGKRPWYARVVRGTVMVEGKKQYFEAAESLGAGHARLVTQHILPNALPPEPEWGLELALGRDLMRQAWWIMTFPGLAIAITALGFNLLGDGLREALDPRQRRS